MNNDNAQNMLWPDNHNDSSVMRVIGSDCAVETKKGIIENSGPLMHVHFWRKKPQNCSVIAAI